MNRRMLDIKCSKEDLSQIERLVIQRELNRAEEVVEFDNYCEISVDATDINLEDLERGAEANIPFLALVGPLEATMDPGYVFASYAQKTMDCVAEWPHAIPVIPVGRGGTIEAFSLQHALDYLHLAKAVRANLGIED